MRRLILTFLLTQSYLSINPSTKSSITTANATPFLTNPTVIKTCVATGAAVTALGCLKIITTGDECLIERFGKFHRRLGPGYHFLFPIIDQVSFESTSREQVLDVPPQQCYTLDNAPLKADAVVYLRIIDSEMVRYRVQDMYVAVLNLCLTQLREEVGKLTLDESFSSRERINIALLHDLNCVSRTWGVEITRVEIQNLDPSPDILAAMELQMAAERRKRATILKSEGERTTLMNEAEGRASAMIMAANAEKERQRIEAEGLKIAIQTVAEGFGDEGGGGDGKERYSQKEAVEKAVEFLALGRYLETQAKFAGGNGTKVLMFPSKDCLPITHEGIQSLLR